MTRTKRTPEARDERIAARLKRQAAKPSSWPGFDLFWSRYPHPAPSADANAENMLRYVARDWWETERPSPQMMAAILLALTVPGVTVDPKSGRPISAGLWLSNLSAPTSEELRSIIDGTSQGKAFSQAVRLAELAGKLRIMVEAARQPGSEGRSELPKSRLRRRKSALIGADSVLIRSGSGLVRADPRDENGLGSLDNAAGAVL